MQLLLVLLCAGIYHYCDGNPDTLGELSEEILIQNDTSVEYWFDTDNVTSTNDTLILHGIKSKIGGKKGKIGSKTGSGTRSRIGGGRYIGGIRTKTNSGSGARNPAYIIWVLVGIAGVLVVTVGGLTLYYCLTRKRKNDYTSELQQANQM